MFMGEMSKQLTLMCFISCLIFFKANFFVETQQHDYFIPKSHQSGW